LSRALLIIARSSTPGPSLLPPDFDTTRSLWYNGRVVCAMKIDAHKCLGCGECRPYCPVGAIRTTHGEFKEQAPLEHGLERPAKHGGQTRVSRIDREACVECGACLRAGVCPSGALRQDTLVWPRLLRSLFSDPLTVHRLTRVPGRGTEEMKTNDVTGRIRPGTFGVSLELGRSGVGTTFKDVKRVTRICAGHPVRFEPQNPLTRLLSDPAKGTLDPSILGERVMSVFVELHVPGAALEALLAEVRLLVPKLRTVLSAGLTMKNGLSDRARAAAVCRKLGIAPRPNGKTNVGLGRPAFTATP